MRRGLAFAAAGAVAMGSSAPVLKMLAGSGLSAVNVIQGRMAIGAIALLLLAVATRRSLRIHRRHWWLLGLYGVFTLSLNQVSYTFAITRLPVGITLLIEYLAPVLIALWIRFVRRTRLPVTLWVGIGTTLLGLALISQVWTSLSLDALGLLTAMVAAATLAGRFLLAEHGLRVHDPLVLTTWGACVGAVALLPLAPFPFERVDAKDWFLLTWIGVVGMAAAVLLSALGQRTISSTAASLVSCVEILVGAGLAAVLLGELLTPVQLVGSVVMLTGIVAAQVALARASESRTRLPEAPELTPSRA
ncbi:DMT family transporter [Actinokineospora xionganensis]|uniref:EamA family transporter n=1 Tax=Actinokineospora xionganensis TaxID=2684470 RepID=A0ABR7L572_9PSEU|nr:DMT family transporter [Actinokineospora xionganensis]MBC6447589.1 EamA family transporter [Actinokineospora xionganensis]